MPKALLHRKGRELIEQFNSELESLNTAFSENDGELLKALTTPVFKLHERKQVVTVVAERMGIHNIVQNFIFVFLKGQNGIA